CQRLVATPAFPAWPDPGVHHLAGRQLAGPLHATLGGMKPDFWAIVRILDRTFSAFVRGQLLYSVITGCAIYGDYVLLDKLGLSTGQFRIVLALIAGLTQLIPTVGPLLGVVPAVAVGLTESPSSALAILAMYISVQFLLSTFVAPVRRGALRGH